ncbi:MAG TPA: hypothetical protein VGO66_10215 [Solirubrobacterales bacterium]|jgi:hypothetical protein|nr:hypothetical protein [Solirubrobacterales bacterium]
MSTARIEPIYRPFDEGRFLLFDGPLALQGQGESRSPAPGQIELQLDLAPRLRAHFFDSGAVRALFFAQEGDSILTVSLPEGADLMPPSPSAVGSRERRSRGEFPTASMRVGDLDSVTRIVFHISGALKVMGLARELDDGGRQVQVDFALPGWDLAIAPHSPETDQDADFVAVVRATPTSLPISADDVDRLKRRLFLLLSFLANREIGVGPICGMTGERVVWAEWGAPRLMPGRPGIKWCPDLLVPDALPVLAKGWTSLSADAAMEKILDRAIGLSLGANAREVLDVRIPIACAGAELLAWTVLQREGWLVRGDEQRALRAAGTLRLMLRWAGIATEIPAHFDQLRERRDKRTREGQKGWEGPELLFDIRNRLMHPPKNLDDPEWPDGGELLEAWQLGTWYLDLALLRLLNYQGEYWSRLRLNRYDTDLEPVPWNQSTS